MRVASASPEVAIIGSTTGHTEGQQRLDSDAGDGLKCDKHKILATLQ